MGVSPRLTWLALLLDAALWLALAGLLLVWQGDGAVGYRTFWEAGGAVALALWVGAAG